MSCDVVVWEHLGQQADDGKDDGEPHNHVPDGVKHLDPVGAQTDSNNSNHTFMP
jgi:hypothetical protein